MAEKFPVGEALNETFQFALNRWGTVLRFGWAPMVLAIVLSIGLAWSILDIPALEAVDDDPDSIFPLSQFLKMSAPMAITAVIAGSLFISFILSGFMASVFRLVALGEERPGFVHLRFDGPAQRVFIANLIQGAINMVIYAAAFFIASLTTGIAIGDAFGAISEFFSLIAQSAETGGQVDAADIGETVAPVGLFFVAGLFATLPMIYVNVRLAPFLAGSASENRLLLLGAFRLTAGNFWPLFFFYLLLMVVMMVIVFVFQLVIGIVDALSALPSDGVFALIGYLASALGFIATLAYQLFVYAIQFGAQGVIYRRLKTGT